MPGVPLNRAFRLSGRADSRLAESPDCCSRQCSSPRPRLRRAPVLCAASGDGETVVGPACSEAERWVGSFLNRESVLTDDTLLRGREPERPMRRGDRIGANCSRAPMMCAVAPPHLRTDNLLDTWIFWVQTLLQSSRHSRLRLSAANWR